MFVALLSLSGLLALFVVYHRLYLHPLAKYPGPIFARLTDWYNVYHCFKGDRHIDFVRLHARYGKIVRYGPNRLSINSVGALRPIYSATANTKKADFYEAMQFYMDIPSTHCTVEKEQHARKRRILSQAFSDKMLHAYQPLFIKTLTKYLERYDNTAGKKSWSQVYDMNYEFSLFVFDAMGGFCFGRPFGALDDPKKADIVPPTFEGFQGLNVVGHMHGIAMLHLDNLQPRLKRAIEDYKRYSAELAHECMTSASDKKESVCVFDVLLEGYNKEGTDAVTIKELESESSLLVLAGSDSTANSLSNVIFNLLNNPHTLERLQAELRSKFTDVDQICTGPILADCEYLNACIDESMRVYPVIGGLTQRATLTGGIQIDDELIPAKTDVGVPHHAMFRNEEYFADPWTYEPRRWVASETSKETIRAARAAFWPLGMGLTECIGKKWALIEIKLTIARMVYKYDMEMVLSDEEKHMSPIERLHRREAEATDRFTVGSKGPNVRFRLAK